MALNLGVPTGYVLSVMDARREQVYTALFRAEEGQLSRITEDRAISLAELAQELAQLQGPIFLVGDGSLVCHRALKGTVSALVLPAEHRMHQRAAGVALAAARQLREGAPCDGATLTPNYLRLSQAERERLAREQK